MEGYKMNTINKYEAIDNLFSWSNNYDHPSPAELFLDLIGYSLDELGENLCSGAQPVLGYLELDLLADALKVVATIGYDAYDYAKSLAESEMNA
jgi:hypothetical protein